MQGNGNGIFKLVSPYSPAGDQPKAIESLTEGVLSGNPYQTLLGVTGSGKTFTISNVIAQVNKPVLVMSHNKTLAAQLYGELKQFFPDNAVEYFISYYDFYQPEAYLPALDKYIAKDKDVERVIEMVQGVKALGMETCVTLGMLTDTQTQRLKEGGLDYYNHNLDTSEDYYSEVITTRTYQDRLDTLERVRDAGINVCCGGIVGMGESDVDRAALLIQLANMPKHPESVPVNMLVQVEGTPLMGAEELDPLVFVRTLAVARIMMPESRVRLSAGRNKMSDEMQALCFLAGANSIFYGDKLLTTDNPMTNHDLALFERLGIKSGGSSYA